LAQAAYLSPFRHPTRSVMMRGVVLLALLALGSAETPNYAMKWESFKTKFNKVFADAKEESSRFETFKSNVDIIYEANEQNMIFELGVNEFADLTPDEFAATHLGLKKPENVWGELPRLGTHVYSGAPLAVSVDWDSKGAVTPVKNQGQCGSCWAFSTTGSLEGAWQIATGKLVSISEQQLVDCDHVDQGCGGGLMDYAFAFAQKNAMCTEESYSYTGRAGSCEASSCKVAIPVHGVTGFKDVTPNSMQAMMEAVSQQPVSIAIEADKSVFQLYKSGVLTGACGTNVDHGVLAVGYGTLNGQDYWKVKNSWGPSWGMNGYVNIAKGFGGSGECAILSQASYPVVNGAAPESVVINI